MILPVLAEPEWSERMTPEDLRALTPLIDVHVTPYGTFHLDLETQWSLEPWPRRRKRDAAKRGIPMSTVYTLIIPNPARTHVFVVGPEPHWTLPEVVFEQPYFWQVVGPINAAVRARFSLEVTTLRCRSVLHDAPHAQTRLVYELEYHGTTEPGAVTGRWLGAEAVDHLPLDQRPILAAWFGEARCLTSAGGRVPWYRPGWRDTMLAWLHRTLNQFRGGQMEQE